MESSSDTVFVFVDTALFFFSFIRSETVRKIISFFLFFFFQNYLPEILYTVSRSQQLFIVSVLICILFLTHFFHSNPLSIRKNCSCRRCLQHILRISITISFLFFFHVSFCHFLIFTCLNGLNHHQFCLSLLLAL